MRRFLYQFFLVFTFTATSAQHNDTLPGNWLLSARAHWGFIVAHRPAIVQLQQKHVRGFEIEMAKPLNGKDEWQQPFGLPLYGFAYQYFDLGDKSELGIGHTLFPRIIFPLNRNHWLRTSISAGVGIGYIEKPFDRYENFKNIAIGSHINAVVSVSYRAKLKTGRSTQAEAGITFTHFSNGTIHPPNLGINVPTLHAGFSWFIGKPLPRTFHKPAPVKKHGFNKISLGVGVKGLETDHGINYYGITSIRYSYGRIITHKSRLTLGTDAFYDRSLVRKLEKQKNEHVARSIAYRLGINFGYEMTAGKITMLVQNGYYVIDNYKKDFPHYIKLGVEYMFTKQLFAAYYLKTHYGKADFFEYAIGFTFN